MRIHCLFIALACLWPGPVHGEDSSALPLLTVAVKNDQGFGLVTMDLKGKNRAPTVSHANKPMEPTWSPDGKRLLFVSYANGIGQMFMAEGNTANAAGKIAKRLKDGTNFERNPVWSSDGKRIAFSEAVAGNWDVFTVNADGTNPVNLSRNDAFDADPSWSPDGKKIAFTSNRTGAFRLFLMNADGTDVTDLLKQDLAGGVYPVWSPDGSQIAFGGKAGDGTVQVFVVNANGQGLAQVTSGRKSNSYSAWSADGQYLAYVQFDRWPRTLQPGDPADADLPGGNLMIYDVVNNTHVEISNGDLPMWGPRPSWKPIVAE